MHVAVADAARFSGRYQPRWLAMRSQREMAEMLTIDWGDVRPTHAERHDVHARLARVEPGLVSTVLLRRHDSGYEARLRLPVHDRSTELRLHGRGVGDAVERLVGLLEVVAREQQRLAR
jgi:CO/xanthine dehydrogenase Mo-binding subunit